MRIASLLASGTELVCALGAGEELVARSHECDDPSWVVSLPCASRPTFDITGSSREIDALVRSRLASKQPLFEVDERLLVELRADVILTQTHCEVCAVSPDDVGDVELCRKQVATLHAGTLDGILDGFRAVAAVIGRERAGAELVDAIRDRLDRLQQRLAGSARPTIACLEWIDPIFHMGNWGPELVELAGGTNLLGMSGAHSTTTPWDDVRRADPEILLVAACGFDVERSLREMPILAALPGWGELRAVRAGRVFVADGNRYFNRSGPSVFESVEILAEILHPDLVQSRHAAAWQRWS